MVKLLKHEFKQSYQEFTIVFVAMILMSVIIGFLEKLWLSFFSSLMIIALYGLLIIVGVILVINVVTSFNRKIFGREGYLTLTLPLSIDKILISKIIVNFFWIILIGLSFIISVSIVSAISYGTRLFFLDYNSANINYLLLGIINAALGTFLSIFILILVLGILNIGKVKKFKILIGLSIFYGVSLVISWISKIVMIIPYYFEIYQGDLIISKVKHGDYFSSDLLFSSLSGTLFFNTILWTIVSIFILYFISRYLIKYKVELE